MRTGEPMDYGTKRRLRPLLEASKRGRYIADSDLAFIEKCFKKWPEEYKTLREEVVDEVTRSLNPLY